MKNLFSKIYNKYFLKYLYRIVFNYGYLVFKKTGVTPSRSYHALIRLYCMSNGLFNEMIHQKIKKPKKKISDNLNGVLGNFSKDKFSEVNQELRDNGYFEFKQKISKDKLDKIYQFAMETPTKIRSLEAPLLFDPNNVISEIYRFNIQDLVNSPYIQELIMDPVLINIAREYLDCEPVLDFPAMWWSTDFAKSASSDAAQLYHFDMDRIKWLKIFIYINDVNEENGPHCYIQKTHKIGAKPQNILNRGYVRVSDEELKSYYPEKDFKVLPGIAGSVFAGDTTCWHKGKPLTKGNRLMLEFEYSSSSFGAEYPYMIVKNPTKVFSEFCKENPQFSSRIKFSS